MKRRMLLTLFVLVLPLIAQEAKKQETTAPSKEETVSKVFEVKYRDPSTFSQLLFQFGAKVQAASGLKALAVTGPPAVVDAIGEAIKRLDMPVRNVELTVHILAGGAQAQQQDTLPKELEGVAKQLRNTFSFGGLRVLDTAVIRGREGRAATASGAFSPPQGTTYQVALSGLSVSEGAKDRVVRIDNLRFNAIVPNSPDKPASMYSGQSSPPSRNSGFTTEIDVREGQKVVVGKANIDESGTALILVVTAKVVE